MTKGTHCFRPLVGYQIAMLGSNCSFHDQEAKGKEEEARVPQAL
jgi:hypothetical protein